MDHHEAHVVRVNDTIIAFEKTTCGGMHDQGLDNMGSKSKETTKKRKGESDSRKRRHSTNDTTGNKKVKYDNNKSDQKSPDLGQKTGQLGGPRRKDKEGISSRLNSPKQITQGERTLNID